MEDLISRQAAIDAICNALELLDHVPQWVFDKLTDALVDLPSVTPQPKVGRWIKENPFLKSVCSECGENAIGYHGFDETLTKFCPNCGCKMMEGVEE